MSFPGRDHPGDGRGHFRAQGDIAFALVDEIIELPDNLLAALGRVKIQRLQRRSVVKAKGIPTGNLVPALKNVFAHTGAPSLALG